MRCMLLAVVISQSVFLCSIPAAAQVPGYDGYEASITNFRFLASDLWSTGEAVQRLSEIR